MDAFTFDCQRARESLPEFIEVYRRRPIRDNAGGMGLNHSFATWFILRQMQPRLVVESGVWRGHSTWLIEQAAPDAEIVAIVRHYRCCETGRTSSSGTRGPERPSSSGSCDLTGLCGILSGVQAVRDQEVTP